MKKLNLIWLVIILLACQDNSPLVLPPTATKIVVNALLVANQTPKIYVGKTWTITDITPAKTYYDNARVELWEDEKLAGILVFKNGYYFFPNFILKPRKTYIIRVVVPDVGKVESKPVVIPPNLEIIKITLDPKVKWVDREIRVQIPVLVQLDIKNTANPGDYLVTSAIAIKGIEKIQLNSLTTENVEISSSSLDFSTNSCYALFPELSGFSAKRSIGYNTNCFSGPNKTIGLVVDKFGQADAVRIYTAIYSAEYLLYTKGARGIEGADNAFIETKPTYSNIVGGIGFVTAINQRDTTIRF